MDSLPSASINKINSFFNQEISTINQEKHSKRDRKSLLLPIEKINHRKRITKRYEDNFPRRAQISANILSQEGELCYEMRFT
jgi:hypothetical protein